jgi:hypothetical protein
MKGDIISGEIKAATGKDRNRACPWAEAKML